MTQTLLKPDVLLVSSHPEISCVALGNCKRRLVAGSTEETAKLMGWDVSTNSPLFQIHLPGFVSVLLLKLAPSGRSAAAVALARSGHKYLLLVDLEARQVRAVHHFYQPTLINDLSFAPGRDNVVTLCGVNYMAEWRHQNKTLT